jgi:hypothetical protein
MNFKDIYVVVYIHQFVNRSDIKLMERFVGLFMAAILAFALS